MDPVSHSAVGYALGRSVTRHRGVRGTGAAGLFGALSPDIDVVLIPGGWDRYLVAHEAGTHSLVGAAICGCLVAGVLRTLRPNLPITPLAVAAVLGAWSHVVFDLAAGAAIRLLWPLADARVENMGVYAMGDPVIVITSLVAGLAMLSLRAHRWRIGRIFLGILLVLVIGKSVLRIQAAQAFTGTETSGARASSTGAFLLEPVFRSLTTWRAYDQTPTHVRAWIVDAWAGRVHLDFEVPRVQRLGESWSGADEEVNAWVEVSRRWGTVQNFERAHAFTFAAAEQKGGRWRILWSDVRYCHSDGATPLSCGIRVGGESDSATTELLVFVGDWVQRR